MTHDAYTDVLHLWGSLLYEGRSNIERMRLREERENYGPCSLHVTSALFPDFCRQAPHPRLVESFRVIVAASKRVDFFQRAAARDPGLYSRGSAFASDALKRIRIADHFNGLVQLGQDLGKATLQERWVTANMPALVDLSKPIDHSFF